MSIGTNDGSLEAPKRCANYIPVIPRYPLRDDCSRCHDSACPQRETCQRWTDREAGGRWTWHCETMREAVT